MLLLESLKLAWKILKVVLHRASMNASRQTSSRPQGLLLLTFCALTRPTGHFANVGRSWTILYIHMCPHVWAIPNPHTYFTICLQMPHSSVADPTAPLSNMQQQQQQQQLGLRHSETTQESQTGTTGTGTIAWLWGAQPMPECYHSKQSEAQSWSPKARCKNKQQQIITSITT